MRPDTEASTDDLATFLAGFVAAEGCFTSTSRAGGSRRFTFQVTLGATDRGTCAALGRLLGVGRIHAYPRRERRYDDEIQYSVQSIHDLIGVVVPFMDEHLPPSHKREQYLEWRQQILEYWESRAQRARPCTIEGCESVRRAHGLCRRHLHEAGLG